MKYDFDKIIERIGTGAFKTDVLKDKCGLHIFPVSSKA